LIIVEPEEHADKGEADDGPGGFLKDEMLLTTKVEKDDIYARQQGECGW
jgi:protein phosphatase-4 regulatory subunit 3